MLAFIGDNGLASFGNVFKGETFGRGQAAGKRNDACGQLQ